MTIADNSTTRYGGGIYLENASEPQGTNLIIRGNSALVNYDQIFEDYGTSITLSYSCVDGGWVGMGNFDADPDFTTGPQGDYYLSQTAAGQPDQSPCVDSGDPNSPLLSGTTRTDEVEDQGIVDLGYHYTVNSSSTDLWIAVSATGSTTLPPTGGTLDWNIAVGNTGTVPETADIWVNLTLPSGGSYGPIVGPVQDFTFQPGWSGDRDRTLTVPGNAPEGVYTLNGYIGDFNSGTSIAEDHFTWSKSGSEQQNSPLWFADCGGDFDSSGGNSPVWASLEARTYPEPFNPTVTISYTLPQGAPVTITVFDVRGRRISEMGSEWMPAGLHAQQFDGSRLPAGIYIYRLTAGNFETSGKMVLLK